MRIKEIGEKFDVKNVFDLVDKEIKGKFEINYLTKQQITKYKRHGSKLIENKKYMHAHECIFFFQSGFSLTTIHELQDCRGRERVFL